jgi:hypothetical protein
MTVSFNRGRDSLRTLFERLSPSIGKSTPSASPAFSRARENCKQQLIGLADLATTSFPRGTDWDLFTAHRNANANVSRNG